MALQLSNNAIVLPLKAAAFYAFANISQAYRYLFIDSATMKFVSGVSTCVTEQQHMFYGARASN